MPTTAPLNFKILASVVGAQAIDDLGKRIQSLDAGARNIGSSLTSIAAKVGLAFGAVEFVQFSKGIIDLGDEFASLSERTGFAVESLDSLKGAAAESNTSLEAITTALGKFSLKQVEAQAGSTAAADAFRRVGISADDLRTKKPDELLARIAQRFSTLQDGPAKAKLAVDLFGKSAQELIPLLNLGSSALTEFGTGIGADFAARADQLNDTLAQVSRAVKGAFTTAVEGALPALQQISESLRDSIGDSTLLNLAFEAVAEGLRFVVGGLLALKVFALDTFDIINTSIKSLALGFQISFGSIPDELKTKFLQIKEIATGNFAAVDRLEQERLARTKARDRESISEREKLEGGLASRAKAREAELAKVGKIFENSRLIGDGSVDEIRARERLETTPTKRKAGLPAAAPPENENSKKLDDERKSIEAYKDASLEQLEVERAKINAYKTSSVELAKTTEARKIDIEAIKATKNFSAEGRAEYLATAEAIKTQRLALIDLAEQNRQTFSVGAQQAFTDYVDRARDVAGQTRDLFNNAFQNMEDALVDFVRTGQLNFRKFADSLISDIIRIQIRQAAAGIISAIATTAFAAGSAPASANSVQTDGGFARQAPALQSSAFAEGGVMTEIGPMPLRKYAGGGIARSPQLAMFGEGSRPEAYVPLPDGRSIPVTLEAQGAQGGTSVVVNVNMQTGETSGGEGPGDGQAFGRVIANAVKAEIVNQKRPGGILAGS